MSLPKTWTTVPLGDLLIALVSGSRPRGGVRGIESGVPSLGGEHLNYDGGFDFSKIKYVPEEFAGRMSKGHVKTGDILIVKDGATTGKTAFTTNQFPYANAVVNEHVFICRCASELSPEFVFRFLMSKEGQDRILANFQGSAQGGIGQTFAANTVVPVAPLPEQKRIVEKLRALLPRVDACGARLGKISAILKRFCQSVLNAECGRGDGIEMGKIVVGLKYGTSQRCGYEAQGVPVLRRSRMFPRRCLGLWNSTPLGSGAVWVHQATQGVALGCGIRPFQGRIMWDGTSIRKHCPGLRDGSLSGCADPNRVPFQSQGCNPWNPAKQKHPTL